MRVLHFLQPFGNRGGEPLTHILDLARDQARDGHDIGIVLLHDSSGSHKSGYYAQTVKFCTLGSLSLRIDQSRALSKITSLMPALQRAASFTQELVADPAQGPLVLHGHGASGGDVARYVQKTLVRKKAATICVYSPHGISLEDYKKDWPFPGMHRKVWHHANGVIFNTASYQQLCEQANGRPLCATALIYDGLKEEDFAPRQIIDMAADFVFVGALDRHGGIDLLIKAMARMKNTHSTGALVVGSGPHENELRAQVDRYGLTHKIYFNAPLDAKTVFLKGGCLVLPSKMSSIPTIALRAAAAGMPMIMTNEQGLPELTGEIDMPLIAPNDTGALQDQMIAYLESPQAFLARATALRARVAKQFTLARMRAETDQFYQKLLKDKS